MAQNDTEPALVSLCRCSSGSNMKFVCLKLICAALLMACAAAISVTTTDARTKSLRTNANALIREERSVVVNGQSEIWRLEWESPPKLVCGPESDLWLTCPCSGFAYGESGEVDLVRAVNGRVIDRLQLTPLFEPTFADQKGAILQRWPPKNADLKHFEDKSFSARVHARAVVTIMRFGDYNHDGWATEFFLQTGVAPCGKIVGTVVGLTARNPKLHAFGSVANPGKPLYMQKREWEALRKTAGPVSILDWDCGDHGSENEEDVELRITEEGIRAVRKTFECTESGKRGHLVKKQAF